MSNYWNKRQAEQKEKFQKKTEKEIAQKMGTLYRAAAKDIEKEMTDLYLTILAEGDEVLVNNLYRYNRLYGLRQATNKRLNELGVEVLQELGGTLENLYKWSASQTLSSIGFFSEPNKTQLNQVVSTLWDANGKNWSKNIWCSDGMDIEGRLIRNLDKLQKTLEKGMVDCVVAGVPKDDLVMRLQERFNVSFNEADRLARTELTYIQNQATMDSYKKAGIEKYQYMAEPDDRISEECEELNGQIFNINEAVVGVNYPPRHVNCRCTTIAVV